MNPFFSIIIPLYNKEKHIQNTLDSVWAQTFEDFEVILVNDGSTDHSLNVVNSIKDKRLKVFTIENQGVSSARNFGISKATSDCIAFLDADDLWYNHHLQDLKDLYEAFPNCGLYCKAYEKKENEITIPSKYKGVPEKTTCNRIVKDYFESSLINSIAWTSAVMVPKSTFESVGKFNISYNSGEDTDLWIRIALQFPVAFSNTVSAIHNLSSEHKITKRTLTSRQHIDFDVYEKEGLNNKSLKKYLDLNRYSMAIQYKLENQSEKAKVQYNNIDKNNLTKAQKIIYILPKYLIDSILNIRSLLRRWKINLRLFR